MGGVGVILDKMNWGKGVGRGSCILVVGGNVAYGIGFSFVLIKCI